MDAICTNFDAYVERFERLVGDINIGQYGRYKGRFVRRLDEDQYQVKAEEYEKLFQRFEKMIQSGDTIDDAITADLRAAEIELVFEQSSFLTIIQRN